MYGRVVFDIIYLNSRLGTIRNGFLTLIYTLRNPRLGLGLSDSDGGDRVTAFGISTNVSRSGL